VFAEVVAIEEGLGDASAFGVEGEGVVGHFGYGFEDYGVVGGIMGGEAPGKGGVPVNEAGGNGEGVDIVPLEVVDDGYACLVDVAAVDGIVGEGLGARDRTVEVVGVSGAEGGYMQAGLGKAGGKLGVGVNDGSDGGEPAVEEGMGVEVGRGFEFALDQSAIEIGDDHVLGVEVIIFNAGGFDDDEALVAVDAAGVAEGVENKATPDEFEIGFEHLGAQFFEEHGVLRLVG
jgi:hypothetical protein